MKQPASTAKNNIFLCVLFTLYTGFV